MLVYHPKSLDLSSWKGCRSRLPRGISDDLTTGKRRDGHIVPAAGTRSKFQFEGVCHDPPTVLLQRDRRRLDSVFELFEPEPRFDEVQGFARCPSVSWAGG